MLPHLPSQLVQATVDALLAARGGRHRRCERGGALWHLWRAIVYHYNSLSAEELQTAMMAVYQGHFVIGRDLDVF